MIKILTEIPNYEFVSDANRPDKTIIKWSGKNKPPLMGAKITLNYNGLGTGIVVGYFVSQGYLGCRVQLDNPPAWFLKNVENSPDKTAGAYGAEIKECL